MATLTIRNVPEDVKQTLRVRAAQKGHSLEEALRQLVSNEATGPRSAASRIDADEIMRRASELETDEPSDSRYKYFTQKELSDAISGEYDELLMVIDTSAIVAIARREPEALLFSRLLERTPGKLMATPTYLECAFVLAGVAPTKGLSFLHGLVSDTFITLIPFGENELDVAIAARLKFSRGSGHPAKLNFGDCFAYALARTRNLPLLFKGDDFIHTDIEPALKPA